MTPGSYRSFLHLSYSIASDLPSASAFSAHAALGPLPGSLNRQRRPAAHRADDVCGEGRTPTCTLATQEADIVLESGKAPKHAKVTLWEYGRAWITQRPIKPSTRERYWGDASWTHSPPTMTASTRSWYPSITRSARLPAAIEPRSVSPRHRAGVRLNAVHAANS